jgi:hypothetical protein
MKRKTVNLWIDQGEGKKVYVAKARCGKCTCFEKGYCSFFDGWCHFNPKVEEKWEHDWCQQFIPDQELYE